MCQGYSVVRAKKSHDIYVPEKKDKKQLVSKRDGAQSKNPVLQCLDLGCTYLVIPIFGVSSWESNENFFNLIKVVLGWVFSSNFGLFKGAFFASKRLNLNFSNLSVKI